MIKRKHKVLARGHPSHTSHLSIPIHGLHSTRQRFLFNKHLGAWGRTTGQWPPPLPSAPSSRTSCPTLGPSPGVPIRGAEGGGIRLKFSTRTQQTQNSLIHLFIRLVSFFWHSHFCSPEKILSPCNY